MEGEGEENETEKRENKRMEVGADGKERVQEEKSVYV